MRSILKRTPMWLGGLLLLALAIAGVWNRWRQPATSPLVRAIPDNTFLSLSVDVDALRRADLFDTSHPDELCAVGLMRTMKDFVVVVPSSEKLDELAFAFRGSLHSEDVSACAARLGVTPNAIVSQHSDVVLFGRAPMSEQFQAGLAHPNSGPHVALRETVPTNTSALRLASLVALLPEDTRDRVRRRLGEGHEAMHSILTVDSLGLAADADEAQITLRAVVHCQTGCDEIRKMVLDKKTAWAGSLRRFRPTLADSLERLAAEGHGRTLSLTLALLHPDVKDLLARLVDSLSRRTHAAPLSDSVPSLPTPSPLTSEHLSPKDGGRGLDR